MRNKIFKLSKKLVLFGSLLVMLLSCESETENHNELVVFESQFPSFETINFFIDNNIFNFVTLEDYELMLIYMSEIQEYRYREFENALCFYSYRRAYTEQKRELPDRDIETFVLLNPEGEIIIQNHKFTLDFYSKSIDVKEISSDGLKSVKYEFGWNHSVLDILFNGAPYDPALKSTLSFSACTNRNDYNYWDLGSSLIEGELYYSNIPLAYKLKAKISQTPAFGHVMLDLITGYGTPQEMYWQSKYDCGIEYTRQGDDGPSLTKTYYTSGTKRLDGFKGDVLIGSSFGELNGSDILHIECDIDDITCD